MRRISERPDLPRLPLSLLRALLPAGQRDEVLSEVEEEYGERVRTVGGGAARVWVWRQVVASIPALARAGWWRGWSGFEPRANRWTPGGGMFEGLGKEMRYTARRLRKRPTYTLLAVATLGLGVAATAAVYSITQKLLLDPLPLRAEKEVVVYWHEGSWSEAEFMHLRPEVRGFTSLAAFRATDVTMQTESGSARLAKGTAATAELFEVLGVDPAIGPGFRPGDDRVGAEPVVVLSHGLWRELGGSSAIIGERLELGGVTRTVVGVMPEGFWFPDPTVRVWLTEELTPEDYSGNWGLIGRLRPGVTPTAMGAELERVMRYMDERFDYPEGEWDKRTAPTLTPVRERLVGTVRPTLLATLAAMAVILLIACVNVAALMLGQVDSRQTELALRSALGAGQGNLFRSIVLECLAIGLGAAFMGAGLALLGFRALTGALPLGALAENARVDWTIFWAAIVTALVAATVVALVPAISVGRRDLQLRLTRARTGGVAGRGGRMEAGLVVAQVALVVSMAAGAAVLVRSVENRQAIDPGVAIEDVAVVDVVMPSAVEVARRPQLIQELVAALEALPGVESAAATQRLPIRGSSDNWGMGIEGRPDLEDLTTAFRVVTPDYFRTLHISVLSGTGLLDTDRRTDLSEGTVVINQELADRYFPGTDPIGQRIAFMNRWDRIVGIVGNVAESELSPDPVPARYMLYEQVPWLLAGQTMVIRVQEGRDPVEVLGAARRAIQTVSPQVAIQETTTMENIFLQAVGPARQVMSLLVLLGGVALALGVVGVYGVVSHFVTRKRRDLAIRLALGLRPAGVVRQVVGRGGALVAAGLVLGLVGFLLGAGVLASFLYGVGAADPASLLAAAGLLLLVGLLAAYVPARRASRIDPAVVLRES